MAAFNVTAEAPVRLTFGLGRWIVQNQGSVAVALAFGTAGGSLDFGEEVILASGASITVDKEVWALAGESPGADVRVTAF